MCYSLQATLSSFALGTHEFAFASAWVLYRDEFGTLERAAVVATVAWLYFCLLIQLTDLAGWLVLLRTPSAIHTYERVALVGTEWTAVITLWLIMCQPIVMCAAPTVVAYVAMEPWRGVILGVAIGVTVLVIAYAIGFQLTMTKHQRTYAGSRHNGLHHQIWDEPHGAVGSFVRPHVVYNMGQVCAAVLQITVGILTLSGAVQTTWLTFTGLFWTTYAVAIGIAEPPNASRISSIWCWFVGGGMFIGTTVLIYTSAAPYHWWDVNHALGAFVATALTHTLAGMYERRLAGTHAPMTLMER